LLGLAIGAHVVYKLYTPLIIKEVNMDKEYKYNLIKERVDREDYKIGWKEQSMNAEAPTFYDTIKRILEPYVGQQVNFDDEWLNIAGKLTSAILNTYEVKVKELLEETFNNPPSRHS